jgi:hypothetical protein
MKEFSLVVTDHEVGVVGEALGNMPHKVVAALISKLQAQINKQMNPPIEKANDGT